VARGLQRCRGAGVGAFDFSNCVSSPVSRGFAHYENNPRTYLLDIDYNFRRQRDWAGYDTFQSFGNLRKIAYRPELRVGAFAVRAGRYVRLIFGQDKWSQE
jgi:hypothetical protein